MSTCTDREAMLAEETLFHAGTRPSASKPLEGAGRVVHRDTAPVRKAGAVTQVLQTSARAGVFNTKDGGLVVMRRVHDKSYAEAVSSSKKRALPASPTTLDKPASQARLSKQRSPPGFPECPPPCRSGYLGQA